jgi:hypothetical protein
VIIVKGGMTDDCTIADATVFALQESKSDRSIEELPKSGSFVSRFTLKKMLFKKEFKVIREWE